MDVALMPGLPAMPGTAISTIASDAGGAGADVTVVQFLAALTEALGSRTSAVAPDADSATVAGVARLSDNTISGDGAAAESAPSPDETLEALVRRLLLPSAGGPAVRPSNTADAGTASTGEQLPGNAGPRAPSGGPIGDGVTGPGPTGPTGTPLVAELQGDAPQAGRSLRTAHPHADADVAPEESGGRRLVRDGQPSSLQGERPDGPVVPLLPSEVAGPSPDRVAAPATRRGSRVVHPLGRPPDQPAVGDAALHRVDPAATSVAASAAALVPVHTNGADRPLVGRDATSMETSAPLVNPAASMSGASSAVPQAVTISQPSDSAALPGARSVDAATVAAAASSRESSGSDVVGALEAHLPKSTKRSADDESSANMAEPGAGSDESTTMAPLRAAPTDHPSAVAHPGRAAATAGQPAHGLGMAGTERIERLRQHAAYRPLQRLIVELDDARVAVRVRGDKVSVDVMSDPTSALGVGWARGAERTIERAIDAAGQARGAGADPSADRTAGAAGLRRDNGSDVRTGEAAPAQDQQPGRDGQHGRDGDRGRHGDGQADGRPGQRGGRNARQWFPIEEDA